MDLLNHLAQVVAKWPWRLQAGLLLGIVLVSLLFAIPILGKGMLPEVSPLAAAFFGICLVLVLLFLGMHIGIAMGLTGFLGMAYVAGLGSGLSIMMTTPYNTISSYNFSVIPLFILMGVFCFYSGISQDFYFTMYRWVGHFPGGLAIATIGGCAGFAAVSGSAVAAAATMGTVSLPEMKRYRYDPALATGCVAAGGTLGVLIPPSILFVIYGIITEQSIGRLFLAGFIPGILQALFYMVTIYILCKRNPAMGPPGERTNFTEKLVSLKGTWAIAVLFLLVIGGIYMGVFTPNEAAGIGAFGAFLIALGRRKLNWQAFTASLVETGKTTSMCFLMLIGAMLIGYFLSVTRFPVELASIIAGLSLNRYIVLGVIVVIFLVAGCVGGDMPMMLITAPIFAPMLESLGFSPIWFGVIMVRLLEIGGLTPPIGMQVYVVKGIAKDISMGTIFRGIVPFLIADFCELVLLIAFPILSLFIPGLMK